jgi:nitrite reductase/ring-hydroxylating ferredoxin subunit
MVSNSISSWQPVLPSQELRNAENIVAGFVQGAEIALWRSRDGVAQAWDNRCPHRGTRLTLGRILDGRLSCAYHGWEFKAGTGACAVIPAQAQAPVPPNVCVTTYRVIEAQGMVWMSSRQVKTQGPGLAEWAAGTFCRSLSIRASAALAAQALASRGFVETQRFVWQGRLAEQPVTIYFNEAKPDWIFLHLFAESGFEKVVAASRRLRASIEGGDA